VEPERSHQGDLRALARLAEPLRQRIYELVTTVDEPISREAAARALGISRSLAAYHLDTMAKDGLLAVSYARTSGRTGPGAGRTAKLYQRSGAEFAISVPERDYQLAATLLLEAVDQDRSGDAASALRAVAHRAGVQAGEDFLSHHPDQGTSGQGLRLNLLRSRGYQPLTQTDGTVRMRNCPFHRLVDDHRTLVCEMNLALVRGMLEGARQTHSAVVLDPRPHHCCVAIKLDHN
jgi:predicted ArsR family transcriptional regulator